MEIEEELTADEINPDDDNLLKETWPIPTEESLKEFVDYLSDLGLRFT